MRGKKCEYIFKDAPSAIIAIVFSFHNCINFAIMNGYGNIYLAGVL